MRALKNIFSHLYIFVLWAVLSAILWAWIFTLITDTSPDKKVTVYCHVPDVKSTELAAALEENMPEGLKMVKVHSFDYVLFDMESIEKGDIFIIPQSETEPFAEDIVPVDGENGIKVYDSETGKGIGLEYISYGDEDYYLFLGANSVHLEDGKALRIAEELLKMQ